MQLQTRHVIYQNLKVVFTVLPLLYAPLNHRQRCVDRIILVQMQPNHLYLQPSQTLHETGHVLGLGHVTTNNVMNPEITLSEFDGLRQGDIDGIVEIYGLKQQKCDKVKLTNRSHLNYIPSETFNEV